MKRFRFSPIAFLSLVFLAAMSPASSHGYAINLSLESIRTSTDIHLYEYNIDLDLHEDPVSLHLDSTGSSYDVASAYASDDYWFQVKKKESHWANNSDSPTATISASLELNGFLPGDSIRRVYADYGIEARYSLTISSDYVGASEPVEVMINENRNVAYVTDYSEFRIADGFENLEWPWDDIPYGEHWRNSPLFLNLDQEYTILTFFGGWTEWENNYGWLAYPADTIINRWAGIDWEIEVVGAAPTPVPEPAAGLLFGIGIVCCFPLRKKFFK